MKVIGEKKKGIEFAYIFGLVLGIIICVIAVVSNEIVMLIPGLVIVVLCLVILIGIFSTPSQVIVLNEVEEKLYLPKGKEVLLKDVEFVAYKRAKAKRHEYKWGEVHIQIKNQLIKCKFVKDCEAVAKEVFTLVEKAKEQEIQNYFGE